MRDQGLRFHLRWGRVALQQLSRSTARLAAPWGLSFGPLDAADRPGPGWTRVRPVLAGICGSDAGLLLGRGPRYMAGLTGFPTHLGHEVVGVVDEENGRWPRGTRVVVRPSLGCAARQLPLCTQCADGWEDLCERRPEGLSGHGGLLGYHNHLPGSWGTVMWAPPGQSYPVPEGIRDEAAVLAEPLAIVAAGLDQVDWRRSRRIWVIGAGTVGLLTAAWLRVHGLGQEHRQTARHAHQRAFATRLGMRVRDPREVLRDFGGRVMSAGLLGSGPYCAGGADVTIDTVGTASSLRHALWGTAPGGQIVVIGALARVDVDWAPFWTRRLTVYGAWGYGPRGNQTFADVVKLLPELSQAGHIDELVTHRVPLARWREAIRVVLDPSAPSIKVTLAPDRGGWR